MSYIQSVHLGPDRGLAGVIIEDECPNAPIAVKETIADYAMGNPGAARVLANQARIHNFSDPQNVIDLVGWPLSDHSIERTADIWDNLKHTLKSNR